MSLVLRLQKESALTNEELDDNFTYLDGRINTLQGSITTITDTTIPALEEDLTDGLLGKQNLNAKLTSLSGVSANGILSMSGNAINPRTIEGGANVTITNGDGVSGNPTITLGANVVTTTGTQALSNKTISGANNTISNISLTDSVVGILPFAKGGTNAITSDDARLNLNALIRPTGTGIVVKTGDDSSAVRFLAVAGTGLSLTNANGETGNPTITSNATASNTPSTLVSRDSSGNFVAGTITANLVGNISGNAATVTNGVYTNGTYSNPSWITALAGTKVTGIPNSSLNNNTITINGTAVALGGSYTFDTGTTTNTANQLVRRDSSGNIATNNITANDITAQNVTATFTGNLSGNASTVTNGVYTTGSYNNPSWITGLAGSKVTSIPNASLTNSSITINGTPVALGGSVTLDTGGASTNTPNTNVKRDGSGNFAAGTITANLTGNATTATSAQTSITAQRLQTPRTINGVSFDGSANITITDNTKLALGGGTLTGMLTLSGAPTQNLHAATKQYVDTVATNNSGTINAWVVFNGTTGTIIRSYNVSSVVRISAGRFNINFPNGLFSDGNYCVTGMASDNDHVVTWNSSTATTLTVYASDAGVGGNNNTSDTDRIHLMIIDL